MFAEVFAFVLIAVHVTAEIPLYIHICGRRDPNLDQCIMNNVKNLKDKVCEGIPDLNIQSSNPFLLDQLVIYDTPDHKLYIKDSKVTGLCDFVVNFFHIDIDKLHCDIDLSFKQFRINGTYNIYLRLLTLPVTNEAQFYVTTDNVGIKVAVDLKLVTKDDQKYMFISKVKLGLDVKGYNIEFLNGTESSQWREIVKNFLIDNQKEIIKNVMPLLQETISKRIISISNDIFKHFTYEELFPDRI